MSARKGLPQHQINYPVSQSYIYQTPLVHDSPATRTRASSENLVSQTMCSLGKILAQDFQMAAVTKILMRREKSIAPLLSLGDEQKTLETQKRTR